jgi:hypothetical protein
MRWTILKTSISVLTILAVSSVSQRSPRMGALLLTLPIVSILAFVFTWTEHHELQTVSRLARETLILVPLGLPFFVPLAFAERLGLTFWTAFVAGLLLASLSIGAWLVVSATVARA